MGVSMDSSELGYGWAEVGLPVGRISGTAGLKLEYGLAEVRTPVGRGARPRPPGVHGRRANADEDRPRPGSRMRIIRIHAELRIIRVWVSYKT